VKYNADLFLVCAVLRLFINYADYAAE